jgi:sarcosine oxidase subunit gamma
MHEHLGFDLRQIDGRSIVKLRVRPSGANVAGKALHLPQEPFHSRPCDPVACWLGPDQWLLTSENRPVAEILDWIEGALSGQLYAATNMSSGYSCFAISGPAARVALATGCGIDMHETAFTVGRCVRTRFAQVPLIIVGNGSSALNLYVDRSYANYLQDWLTAAGKDPITCEI